MKRTAITNLNHLFGAVSAHMKLYIPADDASGQASFTPWHDGAKLTEKLNTVRSAKDLFFPQIENLAGFKVAGKQISLVETRDIGEPFAVFGVRACDCRSFEILDRVFLSQPADTYYQTRRENGTVITVACTHPAETCFCSVFGIDAGDPAGDVTCWLTEDSLYWRANTEKGRVLTEKLPMLEDCGEEAAAKQQEEIRQVQKKLPLSGLDLTGFDREHMLSLFGSSKWSELSESCLGCGTCTFVCPTCQCYDVQEFNTGTEIKRFRCWDSCMYSDFTQMSAGQPRPTQKERFRQRFMHKLVYFPSNNDGIFGCVGCGRCLQKCPIHMNIVKVAKALKEEIE